MRRLLTSIGIVSLSACTTLTPVSSIHDLTPGEVAEVRFAMARDVTAASSSPTRVYPLSAVEVVRGPVLSVRGDTLLLNVRWVGSPLRPHSPAADARLTIVHEPSAQVRVQRNSASQTAIGVVLSMGLIYGLLKVASVDWLGS